MTLALETSLPASPGDSRMTSLQKNGRMGRQRCVGAVVTDEAGRLLVIRRGRPPGEGLWSLPGGRVEPGEQDAAAVVRELYEETGLAVRVGALVGTVERPGPGGVVYEIHDYAATAVGGTLRAGDDAADARWVTPEQLRALPCTSGLVDILVEWRVLPRGEDGGGYNALFREQGGRGT